MARGPQLSGPQQHAGDEGGRPGVLLSLQRRERRSSGSSRSARESAPDSTTDDPRWDCVEIKAVQPLKRAVTLEECKVEPGLEQHGAGQQHPAFGAAGLARRNGGSSAEWAAWRPRPRERISCGHIAGALSLSRISSPDPAMPGGKNGSRSLSMAAQCRPDRRAWEMEGPDPDRTLHPPHVLPSHHTCSDKGPRHPAPGIRVGARTVPRKSQVPNS